jgi:branched-chain amino acid transport system ATP-binding protein
VAIDGVSFVARAGEITALIGPNGAGKTTAFNCITGFYRPSAGSITLTHADGAAFELHRLAGHKIASRARVARTFQNIRLFAGMSVLENLLVAQHQFLARAGGFGVLALLGTARHRAAERVAMERARHWLGEIDLMDRADSLAGTLPYGAQRRLEIARAMCTDPVLLCLDEPAAGLNPRESEALAGLLRRIRALPCAMLLIEHDMSVVMRISDQVIVLDGGRKIAEGDPAAVRADRGVIAAYLGEEVVA